MNVLLLATTILVFRPGAFQDTGEGRIDRQSPNVADAAVRLAFASAGAEAMDTDGEPRYEDHPIDWNPENGWFDAVDVRQAAYASVLAGAAGHTYGDHSIWQMWEPGRMPASAARTPWRQALSHPGAAQMGFMKRLFLSRPFLDLVPDPSVIRGAVGETPADAEGADAGGADDIRAARDAHGRYLIAYAPYGRPIDVDLSVLSGDRLRAWWFDPRTGVATAIGTLHGGSAHRFDPPGDVERGNEWVLVVDDAEQAYAAPGTLPALDPREAHE